MFINKEPFNTADQSQTRKDTKTEDNSYNKQQIPLVSLFGYWREHMIMLIYTYIQSDSGGICETSGNDSMCDSKQKSSYEHGSDFEELWPLET